MDQYREVTREGVFSRLGNSIGGVLIGLLLVLVAMVLLWWNEGRAVDRAETLEAGFAAVTSVAADTVEPANDGALVHVAGPARGDAPLTDTVFDITTSALKFQRRVEMYQWQEEKTETTKTETGGSTRTETTYSYNTVWSPNLINSANFRVVQGHVNPTSMPVERLSLEAAPISLGAFQLHADFTRQIDRFEQIRLGPNMLAEAPDAIRTQFQLVDGKLYQGTPTAPQVGDVRIGFFHIPERDIAVVGQQTGDQIVTYRTRSGEISLLDMDAGDADAMFAQAEADNALLTWLLRVAGFILAWIGLAMLLGPIQVVADIIPFVGRIVGAGVGLVTFILAAVISLGIVALAWVFYRPVIALIVVGIALFLILGGGGLLRKRAVERDMMAK